MQSEIFNYSNVNSAMGNIDEYKTAAYQALNNGTERIDSTIGTGVESADTALTGTAATQVKAKWEQLTDKFVAFNNYIDEIIRLAGEASSSDDALEQYVASSVGSSNN